MIENKTSATEVPIELFKFALEATADGVVITHKNGDILWVNPAYEKLTGYSMQEVQGKNPKFLKSGKQESLFYKDLWETIASGRVWHGELWNRRKDGSVYLEDQSITPVKNEKGVVTHFVAIKRNITKQYQLQNQLNMAQRIEAIGKLTAGVAHNFNNKLASILGYAELAVEESEQYSNEDLIDYLQEITIAGKFSRDIVRQMMAFSRDDINKIQFINLQDIIKESIKILSSSLPSSVKLITNLESVPKVKVDPVRLHQMILSLVINASEAMQGKGVITVGVKKKSIIDIVCSSCHESVNGDFIVLYVNDTGIGIEHKNMENIFLPFFTTREKEGGTGMGLSALHGMQHDQNGHVFVESIVGQGSEFSLIFPEDKQEVVADKLDDQMQKFNASSKERVCILIVDDEASVANVLSEILANHGYDTVVEINSKTALMNFSENPDKYDLVITDHTMPNLTGVEFSILLKKIKNDIPIILMTGYEDNAVKDGLKEVDMVLIKPFETGEILKSISELISK